MMMLCAACVASAANYLTFTAEEDGSTFGIVNQRNNPDIQYSLDGGETWTALAAGDTITLAHKGDKALLRGDNPEGFSKDFEISSSFTMTGKIAASGSVMSLIDNTGETLVVPAAACFCRLFYGCTSLTQAPALPATTLAEDCYSFMFVGCTSLTQAPELPATTLAYGCYGCIFAGCESLSQIRVSFDEWSDAFTGDWAVRVAPTGTFICPKDLPLEYGVSRIPEGWTVKYIDDTVAAETNYLTFTAEEDGSSFGIAYNYLSPDVQYSLNGGETWTELAVGDTILLAKKGDKALLRGYNESGLGSKGKDYVHFVMTGTIVANGSVMSLIDGVGLSTKIPCSECFCYLFENCTSLTQAPEVPATTLAEWCYYCMFSGCTSLTQAPELPATTLARGCYNGMFYGCTGLTQAPELPATTLARGCYSTMFSGCTSLTQAPVLPAVTLAEGCYASMFYRCTSLTQAPELPAKEFLGKYSYSGMFSGCTSLSEINVSFDDWDKLDATFEWVADVAPTGTFICPKTLALEYGISRIPEGWTVKYIDDMVAAETNYLTFTAEEDGSSFGIVNNGDNNPDVQYSLDGGETWTALTQGDSVVLAHKGDKALLRGNNPEGLSKYGNQYSTFKMTGKVAASGSVMSLIDGVGRSTEIPNGVCFYSLFRGCASLTQAPELPATKLNWRCYESMFAGCTSLTQAPELPATTLADHCYSFMFEGCTSLTQAPELPATNTDRYCYQYMFAGCTSLTKAPVLPATFLAGYCYYSMFSGCTSLSEINVSFTSWLGTEEWVKDVAPTGTFYCPKALPLEYGVSRIPEGWTVKYIEDGSGVNTTLADNISVWSDDLTIFVRGAEGEVSLYDMSGRIVATSNSTAEERALSVPSKGAYVVRTNNGTSDVLVR